MTIRLGVPALLLAALVATPAIARQAPAAAATFDAVWTIVRDTRFDPAFNLAQWDEVRAELRPKAVEAKTPGELRAVLKDMLGRIGLSHFVVIPASPDSAADQTDLSSEPGIDVRLIDRQVVVTSVEPGSAAATAQVHPGWIVQSVDGKDLAPLLRDIPDDAPQRIAQLQAWRIAAGRLRGPLGSSAAVTFVDGTGAAITKTLHRLREGGEPVTVGSLPTMFVRVSSDLKTTPGGGHAGLIAFNVWMTAVDPAFQKAMDQFRSADGVVVDLRGNPGGLAAMIMGLSGHFMTERATLGVMKTKDSELRFFANPRLVNAAGERVEPFKGPLAIVVDGMTGSASECFAGGLQSLGRARVFGQTSMGQALPALFDRLPNGDVLIHAWGDFVTGTGVRIEGRGVVPDEPVALTRADLLAGRDAPLEAALAWVDRASREGRKSP